MSTTSYIRLPSAVRTVKYEYLDNGNWKYKKHICYEKTDQGAIESCYRNIITTYKEGFHITEIVTTLY